MLRIPPVERAEAADAQEADKIVNFRKVINDERGRSLLKSPVLSAHIVCRTF